MRKRILAWVSALALTAAAAAAVVAQGVQRGKVDQPVSGFKLRDLMQDDAVFYTLDQYRGKKAVLLTFVSYNCDMTWRYEKRMGKMLQEYGKKDVAFLAVRSSARDTVEGMRRYAEAKNLGMPVLYDEKNVLADYYNVQVTPTFVLIDKDGILRYQGSFDDNPSEAQAKKSFVRDALDAVLAGQPVKAKETRAFG